MTTTTSPRTTSQKAIADERDGLLNEVRALAAKAEREGRGFTDPEATQVKTLLAQAGTKNDQMKAMDAVTMTETQIEAIMGKADVPGLTDRTTKAQAARSRFGKAITGAIFGTGPVGIDATGLDNSKRMYFDGNGNNLPAPSPLNLRNGMTRIPVGRTSDGGDIVLLPEWGGTLLGLLNTPQLTGGDAYRFRRQTTRKEDAAEFVPKGKLKPTAPFGFEMVDDRVRTLAVLSDPIAIQDLQDVASLRDDIGNELANRIIWRLEDAIVNGEQTDTDDAGREMFDGILNTNGVREQTYLASPFRTIRRSLTVLEVAGYDPDALTIALNPLTWEALETETDDNGRPLFSGLYTTRQEPVLFGRPVALSNKIAEGETIIGQWRHAMATLRTDIELSWSDGGEDYARNQVRFRADLRAGFNLSQPAAFVHAPLEPTA